jgi:succinyl-CoA synthetase beta subunit
MFSLSDSLRFMKTRKFNTARFYECRNKTELYSAFDKLTAPVVLKVDSMKHTHKTDVKGVVLNINDKRVLGKEFDRLMLLGESVVIQEQKKGVELIMGLNYDNSFGHVIMLGIGGVLVELLKDVSFRACPIALFDAEDMIEELKAKKVLNGFRNMPKIKKSLIKKVLVKLSKTAVKDNIKTLDLNPIIFTKNDYYIVDARMDVN